MRPILNSAPRLIPTQAERSDPACFCQPACLIDKRQHDPGKLLAVVGAEHMLIGWIIKRQRDECDADEAAEEGVGR